MPDIPKGLLALNSNKVGMKTNVVKENANAQFKESTKLTKAHVDLIMNQERVMRKTDFNGRSSEELMRESKSNKAQNRKEQMDKIRAPTT